VHEVGGAVERIDEPAGVTDFAARLLAAHRETRLTNQELAHRGLAREVGGTHPIAGTFLAHVAGATERRTHDLAAGARGAFCDRDQLVEVELAHAITLGACGRAAGPHSLPGGIPASRRSLMPSLLAPSAPGRWAPLATRRDTRLPTLAHAKPASNASASSAVPAAITWRRASNSVVTSGARPKSRTVAPASMHAR
jgi:hypothetical protein